MAIAQLVWDTLEQQEKLVLAIDNPEITTLAKKIAFYDAMIDAADEDPMDDDEDQEHMLNYLEELRDELVTTYQDLVNQEL